jgi:hypothetical protein
VKTTPKFYLAFKAREHDFYPEFIELAGKVNQTQPAFCVERIERALNDARKPVKGSRILLPEGATSSPWQRASQRRRRRARSRAASRST